MKRSNPDANEAQLFTEKKKLAPQDKERASFEKAYCFLYINQDFFKQNNYKTLNILKETAKDDLIAFSLVGAFIKRSKPDQAFKDFQRTMNDPKYLSNFLNVNKPLTNNICDLLDKNNHLVQTLMNEWYKNASINIQQNREKKKNDSEKLKTMGKAEVLDFLYVNAQFFYTPYDNETGLFNPHFQEWANGLPDSEEKSALNNFSKSLWKELVGTDSSLHSNQDTLPSKQIYGSVKYRTALLSLINGSKVDMENLLTKNQQLYTLMQSIFTNAHMKNCINYWYTTHSKFDDRLARQVEIRKKNNSQYSTVLQGQTTAPTQTSIFNPEIQSTQQYPKKK